MFFISSLSFFSLFAGSPGLNPTPQVELDVLASQKSQDELDQEADGILEDLAALRGVSLKGKVRVAFADKEFFGRYYLQHLQVQYPSPVKEHYEAAYQALGLLGKGEDLFLPI